MNAAELFSESYPLIDRIISGVCRRARLGGADAEDFASETKLALLDNDFAVLRRFEGRSSLQAFLSIVIERLLLDQRTRIMGRWTPSADAERMGDAAVLLEKLLRRDQRAFEEALPFVLSAHPSLTRTEVRSMADRLPERASRARRVALDELVEKTVAASDSAEERAMIRETQTLANRTSAAIRAILEALPVEDRMIIRFRFAAEMSIADISRLLRVPQRPLYRRIEMLLGRFRRDLQRVGLDATSIVELIGNGAAPMDFDLAAGRTASPYRV